MKFKEIVQENIGGAIASAAYGVAQSVLDLFDVPPTQKQRSVNALLSQWNNSWQDIVRADASAKKQYGLALQTWLQQLFDDNAEMQRYIDRVLDVKKTVKNGRPDSQYIKVVFSKIFDAQMKQGKRQDREPYSAKPRVRMKAATAK